MQNKIQFTDEIYLKKIQSQYVYCDEDSKEKFTNVITRKYKLSGRIFSLDIYFFFVLFSSASALIKRYTLTISQSEWEQRDLSYLKKPSSYIDVSREGDVLARDELLRKIKDSTNGFALIARMPDDKFKELDIIRTKLQKDRSITIPSRSHTLLALSISSNPKDAINVLKKLNLC